MYGKIVILCEMKVVTGLHIGASGAFSAIGAVDSPVIRDPMTQMPIVPGSSLKGKLRTLLARSLCRDIQAMPKFDEDDPVILRMFGSSVANPRQIERVVPGVKFGVRIVYDVIKPEEVAQDMEQLAHAMRLLQLDYLGGHGSRGSGRVSLSGFRFEQVESDFPQEQLKALFDKVDNYGLLPV